MVDLLDPPSSDGEKEVTRGIVEEYLQFFGFPGKNLLTKTDADKDLYVNEHRQAFIGLFFDRVRAQDEVPAHYRCVLCGATVQKKLRMQLIIC